MNRPVVSRARTSVRKFRELVAAGDKEAAAKAFATVQSHLDKAAKRGVIHKNAASRTKARLAKLLK